jgi:hypothetical protein
MKRLAAALLAVVLVPALALAQPDPDDNGAGVKRGIQELNNSGDVGTVTLYARGDYTRVLVELHGTSGRAQSVRFYRGADCDALAPRPTYFLADVRHGFSRTDVMIRENRLLSGNYNLVVLRSNRGGAPPAACGHLY